MKHSKQLLAFVISLLLLLSVLPVHAAEIVYSGKCGDNISWTLDNNGLLIFKGKGEMYNNESPTGFLKCIIPQPSLVKKAVIQNGIRNICIGAFSYCENLKEVSIPDSVVKIGACAFYGTGLKEITIPASVKYLSDSFWGCNDLENIHVAEKNAKFCDIDGALYSKDQEYLIRIPAARKGEYTIPEGTKIICPNAFNGCNLSKIILPNSLIGIRGFLLETNKNAKTQIDYSKTGETLFVYDKNVRTADWCNAVNNGTEDEFMLSITNNTETLSQDGKELLKVPDDTKGSYQIPDGVETVTASAFYYPDLSVIKIPDSVKTIEYGTFSTASNVTLQYQGKKYHLEETSWTFDSNTKTMELLICDDPHLLDEIKESVKMLPNIIICDNATELPPLLQNIGIYTRDMLKLTKENGVYYIADIAILPDKPQFPVGDCIYKIREGTAKVEFGHSFFDNPTVDEIYFPSSVKSVLMNHGAGNMSEDAEIYYQGTMQDFSKVREEGRSFWVHFNMDVYFQWSVPGDVSGDGEVTAEDARLALRAAVGLESYAPGSAEFLAADATKDGEITAEDARLILRAAVGLENLT